MLFDMPMPPLKGGCATQILLLYKKKISADTYSTSQVFFLSAFHFPHFGHYFLTSVYLSISLPIHIGPFSPAFPN